jgi:hypothetical protein
LLQMRLLPQQQQQRSRDTEVGLGGHALGGGGISTTQNSLLLLNPDTLQPITWNQVDVTKVTRVVCMSVDRYTPISCVHASCQALGRSFSFFRSVCLPLLMKTSTHIDTQPFSISLPPPPQRHRKSPRPGFSQYMFKDTGYLQECSYKVLRSLSSGIILAYARAL